MLAAYIKGRICEKLAFLCFPGINNNPKNCFNLEDTCVVLRNLTILEQNTARYWRATLGANPTARS